MATVIAAGIALCAAILVAWFGRRLKISEFRQAWINELRADVAAYLSADRADRIGHDSLLPCADSLLSCEIQVRTLFEEIWGEIDHHLNYPVPTTNAGCREQLRVLAKVVGAGSSLLPQYIIANKIRRGAMSDLKRPCARPLGLRDSGHRGRPGRAESSSNASLNEIYE